MTEYTRICWGALWRHCCVSGWHIFQHCCCFPGELIPPKSSLTFEVELLNIKDGASPPNVFKEIDSNEDKFLSQEEVSAQMPLLVPAWIFSSPLHWLHTWPLFVWLALSVWLNVGFTCAEPASVAKQDVTLLWWWYHGAILHMIWA